MGTHGERSVDDSIPGTLDDPRRSPVEFDEENFEKLQSALEASAATTAMATTVSTANFPRRKSLDDRGDTELYFVRDLEFGAREGKPDLLPSLRGASGPQILSPPRAPPACECGYTGSHYSGTIFRYETTTAQACNSPQAAACSLRLHLESLPRYPCRYGQVSRRGAEDPNVGRGAVEQYVDDHVWR